MLNKSTASFGGKNNSIHHSQCFTSTSFIDPGSMKDKFDHDRI